MKTIRTTLNNFALAIMNPILLLMALVGIALALPYFMVEEINEGGTK